MGFSEWPGCMRFSKYNRDGGERQVRGRLWGFRFSLVRLYEV